RGDPDRADAGAVRLLHPGRREVVVVGMTEAAGGMENQDNKRDDSGKRWYVVHAYSGFEKSVAQALRDRIVRAGMQDRFGDVLVPTEEVVEMRAGQKRRSERKFFPGY